MIYKEESSFVDEKSRILVKEKDDKHFKYLTVKKLINHLENDKTYYTIGKDLELNKITKITFVGVQDFVELRTFVGSKLFVGKGTEVYVDDEWIKAEEILYHEKIYQYNLLDDTFRETFITKNDPASKRRSYRIETENSEGLVVDNFIVRFVDLNEDFSKEDK